MMGRLIAAFAQFFDGNGDPLVNGWLTFLESGSNNTKKNTYADALYQIPNTNPVQLDAEGRCPNIFGLGQYRIISYISDPEDEETPGQMIQMFDPVEAQNTITGGGGSGGFQTWDSGETYSIGDIVTYNTKYYKSLVNDNLALVPTIETGSWEEIDFVRIWNDTVYYSIGDWVWYENNGYISIQNLNLNNTPTVSPAYWRPIASNYYKFVEKTTDYEILPTERDYLFLLGSATSADRQFDLPATDATMDTFCVGIYNASDYNLTISALGSTIWIDTSGDVIITKGAFVELIYVHTLSAWIITGNTGSTLGGQNLGTSTTPVLETFSSIIHEFIVPDDEKIFFGTDSDHFLEYLSGSALLNFSDLWEMTDSGNLLPSATNLTPSIGSATRLIANAYITAVNSTTIYNTGAVELGSPLYLTLSTDGATYNSILSYARALTVGTTDAYAFNFATDNTIRGYIDALGVLYMNSDIVCLGDLYVGSGSEFRVFLYNNNIYLDTVSASSSFFILMQGSVTAQFGNDGNVGFYGNIIAFEEILALSGINVSGVLEYDTLNDGTTNLTASLLEINQRCDGVPYYQESYYNGTLHTATATVVVLALGTVTADSYAMLDFGALYIAGSLELVTSGTAVVSIGSSIGAPLVIPQSTVPDSPRCVSMHITGSGTLTLSLNYTSVLASDVTNPYIRVTWFKKV